MPTSVWCHGTSQPSLGHRASETHHDPTNFSIAILPQFLDTIVPPTFEHSNPSTFMSLVQTSCPTTGSVIPGVLRIQQKFALKQQPPKLNLFFQKPRYKEAMYWSAKDSKLVKPILSLLRMHIINPVNSVNTSNLKKCSEPSYWCSLISCHCSQILSVAEPYLKHQTKHIENLQFHEK